MKRPHLAALICLLTAVSGALVFVAPHGALRFAGASFLLIAAPGLAFVPLLGLSDFALNAVLVVLLSLTVDVIVAQAITYISSFSWRAYAIAVLGFTSLGLMIQLTRRAQFREG